MAQGLPARAIQADQFNITIVENNLQQSKTEAMDIMQQENGREGGKGRDVRYSSSIWPPSTITST